MSKWRFVAVFLVSFAFWIVLNAATGALADWGKALEAVGRVAGPVVNGWWLEARDTPSGRQLWLKRGSEEQRFLFDLEKLGVGLFPFLSLVTATPRLGWRRRLVASLLGVLGFFVLDSAVVLLYPVLVVPGAITDIAGTFLGLLTFVGAPAILWFALTFRELRGLWRLR